MTVLLLAGFALAAAFLPRTTFALFVLLFLCGGCVEANRGAKASAVVTFAQAALLAGVGVAIELQTRRLKHPIPPP